MKQRKNSLTEREFWDLEEGDLLRLPIYEDIGAGGVYLTVQRLNQTLLVRAMPGSIQINPLDSMSVLISTNHEDLKDLSKP